MTLTIKDLVVVHHQDETGIQSWDEASPADILAVAATLDGAEKEWWCAWHMEVVESTQAEWCRENHSDCGWRLVIPLPGATE